MFGNTVKTQTPATSGGQRNIVRARPFLRLNGPTREGNAEKNHGENLLSFNRRAPGAGDAALPRVAPWPPDKWLPTRQPPFRAAAAIHSIFNAEFYSFREIDRRPSPMIERSGMPFSACDKLFPVSGAVFTCARALPALPQKVHFVDHHRGLRDICMDVIIF